MKLGRTILIAIALASAWPARAFADDPAYSAAGGYTLTPPYDSSSFTTILAAFPASSTRLVDGYPLASRMLAATGRTVSLQQTFGASTFMPVAVLSDDDPNMDPAFLALTPSGETIALGTGLNKPLYIFPTSLLSVSNPPVLTTNPGAHRYDGLSYYSAAFRDERYLFVDEGGVELGESDVYMLDTQSANPTPIPVIASIPGASSGIAFDAAGDLVTGIGWDPNDSRTGEIKIFDAASIDGVVAGGAALDYGGEGAVVANNALSADSLGFDAQGDLDVGGGDSFGSSGHDGYAEVIDASVVTRVKDGGVPAEADNPADVTMLAPDPCKNDDWTGITYVPGVDMVVVTASLQTLPPNCASIDYTMGPGQVTLYFPPDAPDHDGDGIPDGADPDYEPQQLFGRDQLSRLVDALDATSSDSNFDAFVDFNGDAQVDDDDYAFLRAHWGLPLLN